jgi:ABC-type polysaccharide/polyol phosphate export permease
MLSGVATSSAKGFAELAEGAANWRIWHLIGTGDLRRRYARSRIGQFWLSLSTGLSTLILGGVWSVLWNVQPGTLLPHLTVSIWSSPWSIRT